MVHRFWSTMASSLKFGMSYNVFVIKKDVNNVIVITQFAILLMLF